MAKTKVNREERRTNQKRLVHFLERSNKGVKPDSDSEERAPRLVVSRKERRKIQRKLKKARKDAFIRKKELPTFEGQLAAKQKAYEDKLKRAEKLREKRAKKLEKQRQREEQEREEEARRKAFVEAQRDDEREIKKMEKLLHINKRKKKGTLPRIFAAEGLDYILDAIDSKKLSASVDGELDVSNVPADDDNADVDENVSMGEEDADTSDIASLGDEEAASNRTESSNGSDVGTLSEADTDVGDEVAGDELESISDTDDDAANEGDSKDMNTICDDLVSSDSFSGNIYRVKAKGCGIDEEKETGQNDDNGMDDNAGSEGGSEKPADDADSEHADSGDTEEEQESGTAEYREDIYGRLRDVHGNIVKLPTAPSQTAVSAVYVPPAKRLELAAAAASGPGSRKKLQLTRLVKQLKGLLNKLSEGNMQTICSQIEGLYRDHSRADVTSGLASLVSDACMGVVRTPERLSSEMAMMVAVLHSNVGNEVGAEFVEMLARRFSELLDNKDMANTKEIDNVVIFLCNLYNFQVIHGGLLIDVINRLVERFDEKSIELILLTLKGCGFSLRKDEPLALKEVLKTVNSKASSVDTSGFEDKTRVSFMLEVLAAIKNNNMRKIPNYDPSMFEHHRKLLRSLVRSGGPAEGQLRVSLSDLLDAGSRGKWWLVGSAWQGADRPRDGGTDGSKGDSLAIAASQATVNARILELARKQRMNTDVRRSIFCVIMTSEDYVDAYEKLLKLGLKAQSERELIQVAVDCCMQEKTYNAFYSHLVQKFLELDRRFQMTFQFNLWDKFKVLNDSSNISILNLASMVAHLFTVQALSLSVLKAIEFGAMDKGTLRFMKAVLAELLDKDSATIKATFSRIAGFPKLKLLREGLKIFMQHFLLRGSSKSRDVPEKAGLAGKVAIAEMALVSPADVMSL